MPPVLRTLLRAVADRSARTGLALAGALVFELLVLASGGGPFEALIVAPLVVGALLWRSVPALALSLAGITLVAAAARAIVWTDYYTDLESFLLVLLPITGGALRASRIVRALAAVIAASTVGMVVLQAVRDQSIYGRPAIVISTVLLCGAPFAVVWALRRPELRQAVTEFARDHRPDLDLTTTRARWAVTGVVLFYATCVLLDVPAGNFGTLVSAAPIAAGLLWFRARPDVSLLLSGAGLLVLGLFAPFDSRFGPGETLAFLSVLLPVFGAATSGSAVLRRNAAVLVAATALLGTLLGGAGLGFGVVLLGALPFGIAWVLQQRRTNGRLRVRLRESERRGRAAERGVQVEQERNRIAREVHDVVAHSLAVVIAQADGARFAAETRPTAVAPALEAIADTARAALGEVRTMLHDLRADTAGTVPGPKDIAAVATTIRALGVEMQESTFGEERPLTEQAGLAMFRIAQEALTNALRHGDRSEPLSVEFDWGDQVVVLVISNAVLDTAVPATERGGHGIPGMRERATLVGGECMAGVGSNGRFRVRATLPLLPAPAPAEEEAVDHALSLILAAGARAA